MILSKKGLSLVGMMLFLGLTVSASGLQQVQGAATLATNPLQTVLYASAGPEIIRYEVNLADATLTKKGSLRLASAVQYAAHDAENQNLYVVSSDFAPVGKPGKHFLTAFRINRFTGELTQNGPAVVLPERPINTCLDRNDTHVLVAYNGINTVEVYNLHPDGTIGELAPQAVRPATGLYTHQVMVAPSNKTVITPGLGTFWLPNGNPDGVSSLTVFDYADGTLTQVDRFEPGAGIGLRHLDFHPTQPWVYVVVELGNKLYTFSLDNGKLSAKPLFSAATLADPNDVKKGQHASAIHVHPNGKYLYVTNRAPQTVPVGDQKVFAGGENSIAVFQINQRTGEPTLIQTIDTHGFEPRTFAFDSTGKILVVANQIPMLVKEGTKITNVSPSLAVYRMGDDGKLKYVGKYDITTDIVWWVDMVTLK